MAFLKAIIQPSYWFTHQNPVPHTWLVSLSVFFGLLVLIGLVCLILSNRKSYTAPVRTYFSRWSSFGFASGLVGYILLFFSWQRVAFLSVRFLYIVWLVSFAVWAYKLLRYGLTDLPARLKQYQERMQREQYLPSKG